MQSFCLCVEIIIFASKRELDLPLGQRIAIELLINNGKYFEKVVFHYHLISHDLI